MADKKGVVDIWVVDTNTIYRDVPFTVVTDWAQQGRLLPTDKVRPAGGQQWQTLGEAPAFQAYFPRPEPARAEDPAEALAPVEPDFAWTPAGDEEEEDVDMIPLIDVSLVLLIFFMMTAAVSSGVLSPIKTPPAKYELDTIATDMYWIGIDGKSPYGHEELNAKGWPVPWYSVGKGNDTYDLKSEMNLEDGQFRNVATIMKKLEKELAAASGDVRIRLRGDEALDNSAIQYVTLELQKLANRLNAQRTGAQQKVSISVSGEVSVPQS